MSQEYKNTKDTIEQTSMSSRVMMNKEIFSSICGFRKGKIGTISNSTDNGHKQLLAF